MAEQNTPQQTQSQAQAKILRDAATSLRTAAANSVSATNCVANNLIGAAKAFDAGAQALELLDTAVLTQVVEALEHYGPGPTHEGPCGTPFSPCDTGCVEFGEYDLTRYRFHRFVDRVKELVSSGQQQNSQKQHIQETHP